MRRAERTARSPLRPARVQPCTAIALLIATATAVAPVSSFRLPLGPGCAAAIPRRRLLTPLAAAYPRVSIPPRDLRGGGGGDDTSSPPDSTWIRRAADRLRRDGVCALVAEGRGDEHPGACLDAATCDDVRGAATSRLKGLQEKVRRRGVDPDGVRDGPYRFREVVCRDEGGRRFDVPVPWMPGGGEARDDMGTPLSEGQAGAIERFQLELDEIVNPVVNALWSSEAGEEADEQTRGDDGVVNLAAAGFLVNQPGSASQKWHRDGPDEGFIDVFVPLVDLTDELGPTSLVPGTHLDGEVGSGPANGVGQDTITPLLQKGDILLFDYRTLHRGIGNTSGTSSRALAYAVYSRQAESDVHNFPDALTLEYD